MAERLGFEPRKELPLCRFSRPVLSTAQPSLHVYLKQELKMITFILIFANIYKASITNGKSYKIIILGRNFNISSENVSRMLLGNTKKNTCFFFIFFLTIYSQLLEREVC